MHLSNHICIQILTLEGYSSRTKQCSNTKLSTQSAKGLYYRLKAPSAKHSQHKKQLAEKRSREHDDSQALKSYEQEVHPWGETLSEAHKLWRVKVVTAFMRAGVPLAKLDHFRDLLEEHAYSLSV